MSIESAAQQAKQLGGAESWTAFWAKTNKDIIKTLDTTQDIGR